MFDLCCIILLYLTFLLYTFGLELFFLFDVIIVVCVTKLCITLIKRILKIPSQAEDIPKFWSLYMNVVIRLGASMACLMFTAFAGLAVKIAFVIWMVIVIIFGILIKRHWIREHIMLLAAVGYGFILAKWYLVHPLEGRFGNRGIDESLVVLLSAVMLMIPICMINSRKEYDMQSHT